MNENFKVFVQLFLPATYIIIWVNEILRHLLVVIHAIIRVYESFKVFI